LTARSKFAKEVEDKTRRRKTLGLDYQDAQDVAVTDNEAIGADAKSVKYGLGASHVTSEIRIMSPTGKTGLYVLHVLAGFEMTVARGTEQDVLRALIDWRAETSTGG
jgi:hypothetical protein